MKVTSFLLYPFSLIYGSIMRVRNKLYDEQYFSATTFPMPIINIGNLTVGGTGKTPHVEYLLRLLKEKKVATLSRGYKRKTKGYVLADSSASAATLGDEPYQYFLDFPEVTVAVSENRALGIEHLLSRNPELDAIILDDAYQHRGVKPSLNILLTDYHRLFYQDLVLPAGRLREFPTGADRADVIIVTKCPASLPRENKLNLKKAIAPFAGNQVPVFFTRYNYGDLVPCSKSTTGSSQILLVTAIANAKPLVDYLLEQEYLILHHYQFPDHHAFTETELQKIFLDWQRYSQNNPVTVITTRKDAVKLMEPALATITQAMPLFYIPIQVTFLEDQSDFDALIINHLASKSKPENN